MSCSRRDFLKQACGGTLASVLPVSAFTFLTNEEARAAIENAVMNGRGGLGTVFVFAAGNSRTSDLVKNLSLSVLNLASFRPSS